MRMPGTQHPWLRSLTLVCAILGGCDDHHDAGGECRSDHDCEAVCCRGQHCGPYGLCTYACDRDGDCPGGMRCEHHVCLLACAGDHDCPVGWSCEHDQTVCESR